MANGESKIRFEVGRLCFMLVLKATYLGGSSVPVGVRRARFQKDNLQLAGAESHSGCWLVVTRTYLCIKKFHFTKSIDHLKFVAFKAGTINVLGLCCRFLKFRRRCFCWWVVAVVLLFGCDCCCFICWLFVVIVNCVCIDCIRGIAKVLMLLLLLLLFWSSSSLDSLIKVDLVKWMLKSKCSAQAGFGEGQGSRRFFKVLFPPSGNSGKWRV